MDSPDLETHKEPKSFSVEDAKEELTLLHESGQVTSQEISALQSMLREIATGKEKVGKLKSLLGQSTTAQRESKVELEHTQKCLREAEKLVVEKHQKKVDNLATHPTHMELLQDFETNFDRALLNIDKQVQSGGQDTAPMPLMDNMLLQELSEARSRIESLECLYRTLKQNSQMMEAEAKSNKQENETLKHSIKTLQLELKMAQMESDHANRQLEHSERSLKEMQLEIDLVTKASMNNVKHHATEKHNSREVQQLQSQVQALQEWASASAEAKSLAMEHVRLLEKRLYGEDEEKDILWSKSSSLVIGAGEVGFVVLENEGDAVLRWKFDCAPSEFSIDFSILRGVCDSPTKQRQADNLIKERCVSIVLLQLYTANDFSSHLFIFLSLELSRVVPPGNWKLHLPFRMHAHCYGRIKSHGCGQGLYSTLSTLSPFKSRE